MGSPASALQLENVLYGKTGAIAQVTISRPKVMNALNRATIAELRVAFEDARDDSAVRGVILTGAGDKAFAAGADISEVVNETALQAEESTRTGQAVTSIDREPRKASRRCRQWICPGRRVRTGDGMHHSHSF